MYQKNTKRIQAEQNHDRNIIIVYSFLYIFLTIVVNRDVSHYLKKKLFALTTILWCTFSNQIEYSITINRSLIVLHLLVSNDFQRITFSDSLDRMKSNQITTTDSVYIERKFIELIHERVKEKSK